MFLYIFMFVFIFPTHVAVSLLYLCLYILCFTMFRHVCSKVKSVLSFTNICFNFPIFGMYLRMMAFRMSLRRIIKWWKKRKIYNIDIDNLELVLSNYILFRCFIHKKGFSVVLIYNAFSVNVRCFMFGNVNVNSCLHIGNVNVNVYISAM